MGLAGSRAIAAALFWALTAGAAAAQQSAPSDPPGAGAAGNAATGAADTPLRTFTLEKPVDVVQSERTLAVVDAAPLSQPRQHDLMKTSVGVGYVEGADWGTDLLAAGDVKGIQVQANALVTSGASGYRFDNGSVSLFDPDARWHVEGGDVFSNLRGASRGGRFSWQAAGGRRPAVSFYAWRPGTVHRPAVVSYRDQLMVRQQTLLDAEIATDKSYVLRTRFGGRRAEFETSYRSNRRPVPSRDISVFGGVVVWRGVSVNAGVFRSVDAGQPTEWRTASVRLPFSRLFSLTLERAYAATAQASSSTSAASASVSAGQLMLFHRYQIGEYGLLQGSFASVERQQTQSFANYTPRSWMNFTLQLATQRADTGLMQHWEELQVTLTPTRTTTLRVASPVPDFTNEQRFRGFLRQELPHRFALQAEYGRLSAFQDVPLAIDRMRFKLMLYKTWNVATPPRGAEVRGRVLDEAGRPVSGARVKLGPYSAATDTQGAYSFRSVPRGEYDLALDPQYLPADYAWDGRQLALTLTRSSRIDADLLVAPLNAIHGRVYHDKNGNGRFDPDEGVAGAVLVLGDRVTATDQHGAFSFYNVWPGAYRVQLLRDRLPSGLDAVGPAELSIELGDGRPATGVDFKVAPKTKPILWKEPGK